MQKVILEHKSTDNCSGLGQIRGLSMFFGQKIREFSIFFVKDGFFLPKSKSKRVECWYFFLVKLECFLSLEGVLRFFFWSTGCSLVKTTGLSVGIASGQWA